MKLILLTASWLALAAATPIKPSASATPTPTSASTGTQPETTAAKLESTTTAAEAAQTSVEISETPKADLDNLCTAGDTKSEYDSTLSLSIILSLGKLEECAGNTLGDKPISGVLGGVGSLLGGGKDD
ncbi:hypothetical protein ASPVEDRAFT_40240 [Aspergillus versicolor CBS 583.65]|uniref:Uncharacterized protein n=1 Tax=Aspergillus versicolor CBS 583.65 TaxID=1036611 RepID=A0A1L9PGQ6_ASPVE|nr:uncharacterized protein ASPVEDRAFT_40240 [Aspergillus versicolor CBS 583.65]OJJ00704.1 hypothetical protein ASPVEDRAFT_40240 [Aspergillus versicolor CBS 583.65]